MGSVVQKSKFYRTSKNYCKNISIFYVNIITNDTITIIRNLWMDEKKCWPVEIVKSEL